MRYPAIAWVHVSFCFFYAFNVVRLGRLVKG